MAHKFVAHLFGMGVDIAGKALTNKHPHHIGREYQRTVLGIGAHNGLEEHVLTRKGVKRLVVREASGNHGLYIAWYPFIEEDAPERFITPLKRSLQGVISLKGCEILIDHKGDFSFGLTDDLTTLLSMCRHSNKHK